MPESVLTTPSSSLAQLALAAAPPVPLGRRMRPGGSSRRDYSAFYEALDVLMDGKGYDLLPALEWLVSRPEVPIEDDRAAAERADAVENGGAGRRWPQLPGEFANFYQAAARYRRRKARRQAAGPAL